MQFDSPGFWRWASLPDDASEGTHHQLSCFLWFNVTVLMLMSGAWLMDLSYFISAASVFQPNTLPGSRVQFFFVWFQGSDWCRSLLLSHGHHDDHDDCVCGSWIWGGLDAWSKLFRVAQIFFLSRLFCSLNVSIYAFWTQHYSLGLTVLYLWRCMYWW